MNKEAYMSSLKTALTGFEEDLVQEIVADYEERFRVGAAQGKTEEQIVAELGSVEGLVEELSEMQGITQEKRTDRTQEGTGDTKKDILDNLKKKEYNHSFL